MTVHNVPIALPDGALTTSASGLSCCWTRPVGPRCRALPWHSSSPTTVSRRSTWSVCVPHCECITLRSKWSCFPDGEEHKSWTSLQTVIDALLERQADRKTVLYALAAA